MHRYDHKVTRHFLTGEELSAAELQDLLARAAELKADRLASSALSGRSVALIFEKPSTRTRVSFEVGVAELGGTPVVLRGDELQLSRGEPVRDTAMVLSRFVHAIGVRTGPHATLEELAEHSGVPVVNMLTADHHPCQALADLQTLRERFGTDRWAPAGLRGRRQQRGGLADAGRRTCRGRGDRCRAGGAPARPSAGRACQRGRARRRIGAGDQRPAGGRGRAPTRSTRTCG